MGKFFFIVISWVILGLKTRASCIGGKGSTTEQQLQAFSERDSYQIHYKYVSNKAIGKVQVT